MGPVNTFVLQTILLYYPAKAPYGSASERILQTPSYSLTVFALHCQKRDDHALRVKIDWWGSLSVDPSKAILFVIQKRTKARRCPSVDWHPMPDVASPPFPGKPFQATFSCCPSLSVCFISVGYVFVRGNLFNIALLFIIIPN